MSETEVLAKCKSDAQIKAVARLLKDGWEFLGILFEAEARLSKGGATTYVDERGVTCPTA